SAFADEIEMLKKEREHKTLLPGVKIRESINLVTDISEIKDCDIVIFAIPSSFVRKIAIMAAPFVKKEAVVVNAGKGLEDDTFKRLSEVLSEELTDNKIVSISGPSHAEEVALGYPTTVTVASLDREAMYYIQDELSNESFRIYACDDIIGVEMGGAMKNIIALCAGICDGMGYGDNTKAALMTRGMTEIARLGVKLGGRPETFSGLSGMGDLIVTCTSMHSRNRRAGMLIGQGVDPAEAVAKVGTVEGYVCAKIVWKLAKEVGVSMPITEKLYEVFVENKSIKQALSELMKRPTCHETEFSWF
ncbi:MAG: NAD(P)-dependent glycerol-3-phosphate dehydrogenase, partial [Oscillospiraceae bacterium]|nr:NAD(P)-dependent glycerol-3-phosphate dehydrogenase [Oscillospiraceae bacterium]